MTHVPTLEHHRPHTPTRPTTAETIILRITVTPETTAENMRLRDLMIMPDIAIDDWCVVGFLYSLVRFLPKHNSSPLSLPAIVLLFTLFSYWYAWIRWNCQLYAFLANNAYVFENIFKHRSDFWISWPAYSQQMARRSKWRRFSMKFLALPLEEWSETHAELKKWSPLLNRTEQSVLETVRDH